jgi:translation initiation factor 2 alpha subunit (eIF-2alpha)
MAFDIWEIIASLAAVVGVIISAIIFRKSFSRISMIEQINISHDLENRLTEIEHRIIDVNKNDKDQLEYRYRQYLNVWEWFSLLINNERVEMDEIIQYYKPTMLKDYEEIFSYFTTIRDDNTKFYQYKKLCKKWLGEKNQVL